jgi:hypothetical protein
MTNFDKTNVENLTRTVQAYLTAPSFNQLLDDEGFTEDCLNRALRAGLIEEREGRYYATDKGQKEYSLA